MDSHYQRERRAIAECEVAWEAAIAAQTPERREYALLNWERAVARLSEIQREMVHDMDDIVGKY